MSKSKEKKDTSKTKKIVTIVITITCIIILLPILAFGCFLFGEDMLDMPGKPKVKEAEFPFELVYEYNGEQYTVNEKIICEFEGIDFSLEGGFSREWNCYITNNTEWGQYYLDREKYETLYIQIPLNAEYYMGNPKASEEFAIPYIFYADENTGTNYYEQDLMEVVGAKIISWTPSDVLVGNIKK